MWWDALRGVTPRGGSMAAVDARARVLVAGPLAAAVAPTATKTHQLAVDGRVAGLWRPK